MGWLSGLFGPKKADVKEEVVTDKPLTLSEASRMLDTRLKEKDAVFESDARSLHSAMIKSLDEFASSLSNLEKAKEPDKIDGRLLELGKSYRTALSKAFNPTFIEMKKPPGFTVVGFSDYCRKCSSLLNQSENDAMRYVQILKEIYPDAMRSVLKSSDRIENAISSALSLSNSKRDEVTPIIEGLSVVKELELQIAKIQHTESEILGAKSSLAALKARKADIELRLSEIMNSNAWLDYQRRTQDLVALKRKKDEISSVILQSIVSLDKAMKRMKRRLSESNYSFQHSSMLDLYINDPVDAFLKDTNQTVIKEIVAVISRMAKVHDLELDEKKEQKVVEKLSMLESGEFLSNLRFDYDKCVDSIKSVEDWLSSAEVMVQKTKNADDLKSVSGKIVDTESEIKKLTEVLDKDRSVMDGMSSILKDLLTKTFGNGISLVAL